jgi:toxin FitB
MYLVDTNVISERRRGRRADRGVKEFIDNNDHLLYLPVQVIGELQCGAEVLRRRGDRAQAVQVETWLQEILEEYGSRILAFDLPCAKVWGMLRGLGDQNQIDKQIASIALVHDLTVVTRNIGHFARTGVRLLDPFLADAASRKRRN